MITVQQHAHLPVLQAFVHLPGAQTKRGSRLGAALAAAGLACAALGVGAAPPATATPRPCRGANLYPSAANARAIDAATLCLVNRLRLAHHAGRLRANRELRQVAASQITSMVQWDYFADVRPTGQTPLTLIAASRYAAHAAQITVGQNLAWGTNAYAAPAHIVAEWMASPPHREIMLSGEYRDAGVAVMPASPTIVGAGGQGATYAIEFGARL